MFIPYFTVFPKIKFIHKLHSGNNNWKKAVTLGETNFDAAHEITSDNTYESTVQTTTVKTQAIQPMNTPQQPSGGDTGGFHDQYDLSLSPTSSLLLSVCCLFVSVPYM